MSHIDGPMQVDVRSRRWRSLAVVVVGLLASTGAVACSSESEPDCAAAGETGVTAATSNASDGKKLEVKEFGARKIPKNDESGEEEGMTFGFVVKNNSKDVAANVGFAYNFVDVDGKPVLDPRLEFEGETGSMAMIPPGKSVGFGGLEYTVSPEPINPDVGDKESWADIDYESMMVDVEFDSVDWWAEENDKYAFRDLDGTVDDVKLTKGEGDPWGESLADASVKYSLSDDGCTSGELSAANVLYRDSQRRIIGGSEQNITGSQRNPLKRFFDHETAPKGIETVDVFPQPDPIKRK